MMTYYLSGPMSGIPDYNFPAFTEACRRLRGRGLTIISPHEQAGEGDPTKPYEQYLREDVRLMAEHCDALILLPGWPSSTGARMELQLALTLKMPIWFYGHVVTLKPLNQVPHLLINMQTGEAR